MRLTQFWCEDEKWRLEVILVISLTYWFENFVNSLSVGKHCITLKEVKSCLYDRELWYRTTRDGDDSYPFAFIISTLSSQY